MSIKTVLMCAAIGGAAIAAPALVDARAYIDVEIAPPAARVEVVPAVRAGYVWAPGYYNYNGHDHVWVNGHYMHQRSGHHWSADHWEQHGDRWHHEQGHWDRD